MVVAELATDKTLRVKDGVRCVCGGLVFGGVADQPLRVVECNVRWRGAVALVIGDDFDAVVLPCAHAAVGGAKVDADGNGTVLWTGRHVCVFG